MLPASRLAGRLLAVALVLTLAAACSGDGGGGDRQAGAPSSEPAAGPRLEILVTNDDGVTAEGIDVLVEELRALPDTKVTVVAPAEQRSGSGSSTTEGPLATEPTSTASGYPAVAVDGFPADTIRAALDDLDVEPDLVVAGINEGQNIGRAIDISGTVGAARAAAQRGIPAVAVSQGIGAEGEPLDYDAGAQLVLDWIAENRARLAAGPEGPPPPVLNFNAPSCSVGEVRDLVEVPPAEGKDLNAALQPTGDCGGTFAGAVTDDIIALTNGYATKSAIPVAPGPPP